MCLYHMERYELDYRNSTTGTLTSRTETIEEAIFRNSQGITICNQVFREALETRAKDLERLLESESDNRRIVEVQMDITALRPKRFSEGPLVFGLRHTIAQEKMREKGRDEITKQ